MHSHSVCRNNFFSLFSLGGSNSRGIGYIALKSRKGKLHSLKAYNNIYALVIGIDKFASLSGNQQLQYCVKDAKGVRNTLRSYYKFKKIEELYDRDATRSGILAKFQQMSRFIGKNDASFEYIKQMTKEPVRYALTAGDKGQTVLDGGLGGFLV